MFLVYFLQVKKECQSLLVECATPDAIVRLPKTLLRDKADDVQNVYFVEQEHSSLSAYLSRLLTRTSLVEEDQNGLLVQVSTHSRLLSENDLNDICQSTRFHRRDVKLLHLQQFQTEQQFTKQIRLVWRRIFHFLIVYHYLIAILALFALEDGH